VRRTAAVAALLAALAGPLTACSGQEEEPPTTTPSSDATAQTTASEDVERDECPPEAAAGAEDRRVAIGVARCAVIAYTEFSYRDSDHRAWIDRVEPYATETLVADLHELFGADVPAEEKLWKELVEARTVARTVVTSAEATRDRDAFTVTVDTEAERRTKADPDWEPYGEPRTYEVTLVRVGRDWRVADIR
jgi:hypothetical protein